MAKYSSKEYECHHGPWVCPCCEFKNTAANDLDYYTGLCGGCGALVHHFMNSQQLPRFRLVPSAGDLEYMKMFPDKYLEHDVSSAAYNRGDWLKHVGLDTLQLLEGDGDESVVN